MKEIKQFQFQSSIENVRPLKDGTMSITIHTQEMNDNEKLILINLLGKFGWTLFKEDEREFETKDIPKENTSISEFKTPSQRIRSVLYILWKNGGDRNFSDFEAYYKHQMEKIISQLKSHLE